MIFSYYNTLMPLKPLESKRVVLGVTGSIAAYKAVDLASKLAQAGAVVETILTPSATQFITPLAFQSVTGQGAYVDANLWGAQAHVLHVGLGHTADLFIIAPVTAQTMAKLANGTADNLLLLAALAYGPGSAEHPLLIAPAMDGGMFEHPATQANLETLRQRGAQIIGPEAGHLASGLVAMGRMSEPLTIFGLARYALTRRGPLSGRRVVVTAGGTQEPVDPVRVLTNRSSGKQGFALAQAALDAGADVTLIATPGALPIPAGLEYIPVEAASQMEQAVLKACQNADALLMAAAVADFRPVNPAAQKIKKSSGIEAISLEPTTDILAAVAAQRGRTGLPLAVVGFAAETQNLLANAQSKLRAKRLDMIAANDVSAPGSGFAVDTNRVTLLYPSGKSETLPLATKAEVAERIIAEVVTLLNK